MKNKLKGKSGLFEAKALYFMRNIKIRCLILKEYSQFIMFFLPASVEKRLFSSVESSNRAKRILRNILKCLEFQVGD